MNSAQQLLDEVNLKNKPPKADGNKVIDQNLQSKPIKHTGSKYTVPNDIINKWKLNTQFKLYYPEDDFNVSCCCAFFLVDAEWNKESLRALKEQTGANLLIGLQTSDRFMTTDNVIEGMICCETEQVDRIVHQFQAMLSIHGSYIAMDLNDIISFFNQCPYTQYTESKLYSSDDFTEQKKREVEEFIAKLPIRDVKNLLLYTHSINTTSLKQFSEIVEMVDRKIDDSDMLLYGRAMTNTLNYAYVSVVYPKEPPQN